MNKKHASCILFAAWFFILAGCATHLSKPSKSPEPSAVRLGTFDRAEMKAVGISDSFAGNSANQRALKKINEHLFSDMRIVFPNLKRIETGENFSTGSDHTLQITPYVKEIKFIGGGARFWVGAMAGSSAVLMQATFTDSSTGKIIADPEFYRSAGAYAGGWTVGATDNHMLADIARDVIDYTTLNK